MGLFRQMECFTRRIVWYRSIMDFAALVSGGKDSVFNMMEAIFHGYQLKVVVHLSPNISNSSIEEKDSYMYQSVGSEGVELLCCALNVPLICRKLTGHSACTDANYVFVQSDEVEDLYCALSDAIKRFPSVRFVCTGAILSDYQRVRVEHVCSRLGLGSLAFLWRRSQAVLLDEMIHSGLDAVIVKVASFGLGIKEFLGHRLCELQSRLIELTGPPWYLNACGEGGEYETFTLDCPLFEKRITFCSPPQLVIHSDDDCYPVAYLRLPDLKLEAKKSSRVCGSASKLSVKRLTKNGILENLPHCPFVEPLQRVVNLENSVPCEISQDYNEWTRTSKELDPAEVALPYDFCPSSSIPSPLRSLIHDRLWLTPMFLGTSILSNQVEKSVIEATERALISLRSFLATIECSIDQILHCWAVTNQPLSSTVFEVFDRTYATTAFGMPWELDPSLTTIHFNRVFPPSRVCFTADPILDPTDGTLYYSQHIAVVGLLFVLCPATVNSGQHVLTGGPSVQAMHVRSISHWAPASIGTSSQALSVHLSDPDGDQQNAHSSVVTFYSGQIGLIPENMKLINRFASDLDLAGQCWLALRHCHRILKVKCPALWRELHLALCFGTSMDVLRQARLSFHQAVCSLWFPAQCCACSHFVVWVEVTDLPKQASVKWQWITLSNPNKRVRVQYVNELDHLDSSVSLVLWNSNSQVPFRRIPCRSIISCRGFLDRTEPFALLYL